MGYTITTEDTEGEEKIDPRGVINTDHAYGYTGIDGYYNGYYNNWGGYRPLYTITEATTEDQENLGPRISADNPLATIGSNRVLLSGYPYAGYLGHYNGYLNGYGLNGYPHYPYSYSYLNGAFAPSKISGTVSNVTPKGPN